MNILVTNDDGVQAAGIEALAHALSSLGKVTVVAPDRNRSGASNSLTLHNPLRVTQLSNQYYSVEGTPTDCVHLAVTGMFTENFDLVVSGINAGGNLGDDVFYSGTVAAAMEGSFLGIPAMAVSLTGRHQHYQTAAAGAKIIAACLIQNPLPEKTMLNINIPDIAIESLQGIQITRQGTRHRAERMVAELDPRGNPIYWVGPPGPEQDAGEGTDFHAINTHKISMTPLQLDLTHYRVFDMLSQWSKKLEL